MRAFTRALYGIITIMIIGVLCSPIIASAAPIIGFAPIMEDGTRAESDGKGGWKAPIKKSSGKQSKIESDKVSKGAYFFSDKNVLTAPSGKAKKSLFKDIVKGKQTNVIEVLGKGVEKGFTDGINIDGNLNGKDGMSMWDYDLNKLYSNKKGTTITMKRGSTAYKIYIPKGTNGTDQLNSKIIANSIEAINKYKLAVTEGILASSLKASFNVYSMYPETNQVPVTDIMEEVRNKKTNAPQGYSKFKSSGVTMNYGLLALYNPIFGKMTKVEESDEFWDKKVKDIKLKVDDGGKLSVSVHKDYSAFTKEGSEEKETLTEYDTSSIPKSKLEGVKDWTTSIAKKKVTTKSFVDGAYRVAVPETFGTKLNGGSEYKVTKEKGFKLIGSTKLLPSHNFVYDNEGGKYQKVGDFQTYGIDVKSLVLSHIEQEGKDGKKTKMGVIVPLWYKEAVVDTTDGNSIYLTGRTIKFGNDYSGKIHFNEKNVELLAADSKIGKVAVAVSKFAFTENGKYDKAEDHIAFGTDPTTFGLEFKFEAEGVETASDKDEDKSKAKGFLIFRNNAHINDPDLISWLKTDAAKSLAEVKAKELLQLISGKLVYGDKRPMTYDEWLRAQEIRSEMDSSFKTTLMTIIRVLTFSFGMLLICYSILLIILYWIDVLNFIMETSLLNLVTFKRLYPVASEEELEYIAHGNGDYKYVGFWGVFWIATCGVAIGVFFLFGNRLIELLLFMYYTILAWVGGM